MFSVEAVMKLGSFAKQANMDDWHPHDWLRWHGFVIQAHNDGGDYHDTDASDGLRSLGWPGDRARMMGERYYEGRALLALYDKTRGE